MLWPVVVEQHDNRIFGDAQLVEQVEHLTDVLVVLHHGIVVLETASGRPVRGFPSAVHAEVHPGGVQPHEERLFLGMGASMKLCGGHKLGVAGLQ